MPSKGVCFGYFSHHQATLLEAKNPVYATKTQCHVTLTPLSQPVGSYACGTLAFATVLNALQPQQPPLTSNDLDKALRPWKKNGLAPALLLEEAHRRGLYAKAYNHGGVKDLEAHLDAGHVVVVMHRARTQYHYELVQAVGMNTAGEMLITLTDALENSQDKETSDKGFKTYTQQAFNKTCWQKLKIGLFEKGRADKHPGARNAYLNIPTGHDCYYLAFSTQDDLVKPTRNQQSPWIDAPAAWANRWANTVAKGLGWMMKPLGLQTLRERWFGAAA